MYCVSCGKELPDDANFCLKCGKPQNVGSQSQGTIEEPKWETCEIFWHETQSHIFASSDGHFVAEAVGLAGKYNASQSREFKATERIGTYDYPSSKDQICVAAHNALIKQLVNVGWEPTNDRGSNWWNYRFRRRSK